MKEYDIVFWDTSEGFTNTLYLRTNDYLTDELIQEEINKEFGKWINSDDLEWEILNEL